MVGSTPRPHFTPGKTRYPFYRRLGGPQGRSGRAENLIPTGIQTWNVQPIDQSLYRLSYPVHVVYIWSLGKCYIWSTAICGAETWTLRAVDQKHLGSFEMWYWRRMEKIDWTDHVRNEEVLFRVNEQEEYPA